MTRRKHKGRVPSRVSPGRPSNQKLYEQIRNYQRLLVDRKYRKATWQMVERYLSLKAELEDLATPVQAAVWDRGSPSAERSVLPGVRLADDGADLKNPDGDGKTNVGDRNLYFEGKQFEDLGDWLDRQINWALEKVEHRLEPEVNHDPGAKPHGLPRPLPTKSGTEIFKNSQEPKTPRTA